MSVAQPSTSIPGQLDEQQVGCLFNSQGWLKTLEEAYGFRFEFVKIEGREFPFAVMPQLAYTRIGVLPFSDYTDLQKEHTDFNEALFSAIRARYPDAEIVMKMKAKAHDDASKPWGNVSRTAFYHQIDVANAKVNSSFYRGVRKAQKCGLQTQLSRNGQSLERFYQLYHQLRIHKFNGIPQPFCFFESIFNNFIKCGKGFLLEAKYQNKVIGSIIVLQFKGVWYYKFGCSDFEHLPMRPNNLLFYDLIERGREAGVTCIDLGLSGADASYEGLRRFKAHIGGKPYPLLNYQYIPEEAKKLKEKQTAHIKALTSTLVTQEADLNLTNHFSEIIYPYLG